MGRRREALSQKRKPQNIDRKGRSNRKGVGIPVLKEGGQVGTVALRYLSDHLYGASVNDPRKWMDRKLNSVECYHAIWLGVVSP
ncbi:hypothetical protein AVEN_47500-1 [Araneus ventricosus]|uniref:Uncharacterized protein n=1 Tax=Araneus ventricosus TaxID=182803 RepID=A0A4Y2FEP8_ARAVE|nr:hypothetical protein AVEN_47500-1 [Araneus ventricosus]